MDASEPFYRHVLTSLMRDGLDTDCSVLVVCGGPLDAHVLRELGFQDVTISNLEERYNESIRPFQWLRADAESLGVPDHSFDWVIVHAGLHHCASPHRALVEMYRVAQQGILVIEARDSVLVRLAVRAGFTTDYEFSAVIFDDYKAGGLRDGPIPNYIYRWTEREVVKTIESAYPHVRNDVRFFYGLRLPWVRLARGNAAKLRLARVLGVATSAFQRLFKRQCNEFAFAIRNTGLKSWMNDDLTMRHEASAGNRPDC